MKHLILAASLFSLAAAPLAACDGMMGEHSKDKASLSTDKHSPKVASRHKSKADKSIASADSKKAKI